MPSLHNLFHAILSLSLVWSTGVTAHARTSDEAGGIAAISGTDAPAIQKTAARPRLMVPSYPATHRLDLVETQFGVPVADPYRWLEKDAHSDPDVRAWIAAENEASAHYLQALPGRAVLRTRMEQLYSLARYSSPRKGGQRYFFTSNDGLQNFAPLYMREGPDGLQRRLLDPNSFSPDGTVALAEWLPSRDGRYLLYAVQDGGSDWRELRVLDVDSGKTLDERITSVRYSGLSWSRDGRGFYYSRFPTTSTDRDAASGVSRQQVWFHALGTEQAADRLIYETPSRPRLLHRAEVTGDGRWLLVTSNYGTDRRSELTLIALDDPGARPVRLIRGLDHEWQLMGYVGDRLYFRTNQNAGQGKVVWLDAGHPRRPAVDVVPPRAEMLAGGSMIGARFILAYVMDGRVVAELVDHEGRRYGDVPLPGLGAAAGFSGSPDDPETFYSFSSFTAPPTIYRYNVETAGQSIFARSAVGFDPEDYVTEQILYPSRDGTQIPMFIIRRRDLARSGQAAPTLLYGYGGFNVSQTPSFSPARFAWVEQGGVLAIASVRGGGEFGKEWHDAGRLSNKQNVFDDFIAAAEYLKAKNYTGPDQLAIEGRSNGGLLVGAVVNQRPDLFAAALPAVGVMDMLRFDRFTAGSFWVDDYGRPDREPDFRNLLAYSPYHNVREGRDYPAILVTTGDSDDRVVPGHSFKYIAALQNAGLGPRPHLIRIETRAGHGSGKATDKIVEEYADMYSFAAYWTGLKLESKPQPQSQPKQR